MDPFIGEIKIFTGNFAPYGWAFCNGQTMNITQNTALFSLLGTMYGGDGKTTFALPNLQGRAPMHTGAGPGLTPRNVGQTGGDASVTLISSEMPQHSHVPQSVATATVSTTTGSVWAGGSRGSTLYATAANTPMNPGALGVAGGSQPHNNMQPYLPMSFIIALQGIFPPRQ